MYTESKAEAYKKIAKLEGFIFEEMEAGNMSGGEYDWLNSHIASLVSSIYNFDEVDEPEYYDNSVKEEAINYSHHSDEVKA